MPKSLRTQLSLSIFLLLLIIIALISVFANLFINREFDSYVQRQNEARSETIVDDVSSQYDALTGVWKEDALHTIGMYSLYNGYLIKVYDDQSKLLWDAENHDMTLCGQIMGEITYRMENARKNGSFQSHTFPLLSGEEQIGSVTISYFTPFFYTDNDNRFLDGLNTAIVIIGLLSAVLAVLLGWVLARRIARPVTQAAQTARHIADGDYETRIAKKPGTRELDHLVESVNSLAAKLEEQEALRKRMINDVAHELRTPLTSVGLHLEAMIDGLWEATPDRLRSCHEELVRLGDLVKDIQQLASMEGDQATLRLKDENLLKLARTTVGSLSAQADAKELSLTVEGDETVAQADGERIQQVLINLVSNAIKFTPQGGHIRVETEDGAMFSTIRVSDDGIGIETEKLPFIFERFYRADESRDRHTGGSGIGLTIVRSIVKAHGGTIGVESEPGKGSAFIVRIPKKNRRPAEGNGGAK